MALITLSHISAHLVDVTGEQMGRCRRLVGTDGKSFYRVENSDGKVDANGAIVEYDVTWTKEHGFACTCPSGRYGWANVKHASGVCWHVRASVACAIEQREALNNLKVIEAAPEEEVEVLIVEKPAPAPITRAERRFNKAQERRQAANAQFFADLARMKQERGWN